MADEPADHKHFVTDTDICLGCEVLVHEHVGADKKVFMGFVVFNWDHGQVVLLRESPVINLEWQNVAPAVVGVEADYSILLSNVAIRRNVEMVVVPPRAFSL